MKFVWETPEEINLEVAKRLRLIRKRRGFSQEELSIRMQQNRAVLVGGCLSWQLHREERAPDAFLDGVYPGASYVGMSHRILLRDQVILPEVSQTFPVQHRPVF